MALSSPPERIVVVGTGYVGLPAALMWAKSGIKVVGVDIDENVVRAINERTMLINENKLQELMRDRVVLDNLIACHEPTAADAFVIAVPTPVHPLRKIADLTAVEAALESICPVLKPGNLVILESTVPPMTCRAMAAPLLARRTGFLVPGDVMFAHCPERILPGDIWNEIVSNDRLIGGMDKRSTQAAIALYSTFVKGALIETDDLVAELAKLMENTYRDVNIALANELSLICERLDVSALEAIRLANRHPRVSILTPGIGVGGHCIPVDPWFLKEVAPYESRLITTARLINDEMPARVAKKIRQAIKDVHGARILALGAGYKRNCADVRESPAGEIVRILRDDGFEVEHRDPLVKGMRYDSLSEEARGRDLIAVLVKHDKIRSDLDVHNREILAAMRTPRIVLYDDSL
jgi:UDP-N-acetyl-D-mannosaminuronic acid dehydrogenase